MLRKLSAAALLNGLLMSLPAAPGIAAEPVTFNKDVLPILQKNCQSCHRPGQIAPFSLLTYRDARLRAQLIKYVVSNRVMPPWNADPKFGKFSNARSLEQSEIDTIVAWVDQGGPEGDATDKPAPVQWPEAGWEIKPDHIVNIPETLVPEHTKHDVIEWAITTVPSGFTKDTWVSSIEILPDNLDVTHHICIRFMPHRDDDVHGVYEWRRDVQRDDKGVEIAQPDGSLTPFNRRSVMGAGGNEHCYLPGSQASDYRPKGVGKLIPANTDIAVTTHYTPNGKEFRDRPQIGFTIAKEPPQKKWFNYTIHGLQDRKNFAIPPHDPSWSAPTGIVTLMVDAELAWMSPHMHLRGKDMTYTVVYPDGTSETVLRVPKFDFNWQMGYELAQPIKLPKNSKIMVTGHFDNSEHNRHNPDPSQTVYYGDMNWEEMFSGFIGLIVDKDVDPRQIIREDVPVSPTATRDGG